MAKPYNSIRMFKSDHLERLSHIHPVTTIAVWGPVTALILMLHWKKDPTPLATWAIWFLPGILTWTLTEYLLHRFLFHWEGQAPWAKRLHFILHGVHHEDGNDLTRLVMPPSVAFLLSIPVYLFFRAILGSTIIYPFFASFLMGYILYDYTHYYVHAHNPKHRLGKILKKHHMQHHYAHEGKKWGVSSPFWDWIFRTN